MLIIGLYNDIHHTYNEYRGLFERNHMIISRFNRGHIQFNP